ncbi:MAG: HAMP domain-containing sensor histidine kinase [Eubacteriales bacterium]|nr:HAMP domain-containing sensor histidine kinase [Eubacteriales bacterium]
MDTKWKNSKGKSVGIALALVLAVTLCFMAFFPFFKTRADSEFENPLTDSSFIDILYGSNYIQYKYLREKVDQKTWSYGELYVRSEFLGASDSLSGTENSGYIDIPPDAVEGSDALAEQVREGMEATLSEIGEIRSSTSELTQLLDYYALDPESGVSVSNSDRAALRSIAEGEQPKENPYVYYVFIYYDKAGNVADCAAHASGDNGDFLKRLEAGGREQHFGTFYDEDNSGYMSFYNENDETYFRYRFTLSAPSNMKIVYAMTQEQYQAFLSGYSGSFLLPDYTYVSYHSYKAAGIGNVIGGFFAAAILLGAVCVWSLRRKGYVYQELRICRIPLEIAVLLACAGFSFVVQMLELICDFQKGWFLPNLTQHMLTPAHLQGITLLLVGAAFFAYFWAAFTLGSIFAGIVEGKAYIREHSILIRYRNKLTARVRRLYQEMVDYDIGNDAKRMISKLVAINFLILFVITMFWAWGLPLLVVYSFLIYFLLKKYIKDVQNKYQNLLRATSAIAKGDFDIALSENFGIFESYKNELRQIQTDFKRAVDEEVKSQRMKSELITNVSHDLKTPLTAIITYINLLREPGLSEQQRQEYIATLDKKAVRLKVLIEDLFEVSKATTNNVTLNYAQVDICNLLRQVYLEYEDRMEEQGLQFKFMLPEEKVILRLDPQKTFRIFENLYTNIIKYAMPSTRVYVIVRDSDAQTEITIKNISRTELSVSPEELTERFVRGDGARNTEGSGLGLAIARSFAELQHGELHLVVDGDLFKAVLLFGKGSAAGTEKAAEEPEQPERKADYRPSRWRTEKNLRRHGQLKNREEGE